jgi:hypothetical protein
MTCDRLKLTFVKTCSVLLSCMLMTLFTDTCADENKPSERMYEELVPHSEFRPLRFGGNGDDFSPDWGNGRRERSIDGPAGTLYFRLRLDQVVADSNKSYELSILDPGSGSVIQIISAAELAAMPSFLTTPLYFSKTVIRVDSTDQSLSFIISQLLVPRLDPQIQPQARTSGFTPYSGMPPDSPLLDLAVSVAKLHIGLRAVPCTGFLLSNDALLTNFHCLEESEQYMMTREQPQPKCGDILAQFDYQRSDSAVSRSLPACQQVLVTGTFPHGIVSKDEGDFALLRFDPHLLLLPATGRTRPSLRVSTASINTKQFVQMIQHPWGFPVQFALGCVLGPTPDQPLIVQHNCSTLPGSSGSPVFNGQGLVVALHHTPNRITEQEWRDLDSGVNTVAENRMNEGTPLFLIWPRLAPFLR